MSISRRFARPLLSSIFFAGGLDAVQHPGSKAKAAEAVTGPLTQAFPVLPKDAETLVRINGAVQVGASILLAAGKFRRLSSIVLIGSIVPTTYAGHRFWEEDDAETRKMQQMHFFKNVGLLGGLILAAVDTEGAPSLGWRAKRQARMARKAVGAQRGRVSHKAQAAATVASGVATVGSSLGGSLVAGTSKAAKQVDWKKAQQQAAKAAHQIDLHHAQQHAAKAARHGVDVADAYLHTGADRTGDLLSVLTHHSGDLVAKAAEHLPSH